jgi:chromosome partitioning protein
MIFVLGGTKGGAGKSLLAANLTVLFALEGRDILLVDADDQGSVSDFTRQRNERTSGHAGYTAVQLSGREVATQVQRLAPKYNDIVIDVGGRDTVSQRAALAVAHVLLVPFSPRSVDLWTAEKMSELISEVRPFNPSLRAYAVINRAFTRGSDNEEAAGILRDYPEHWQYLDIPIVDRKAFSNAFGDGRAVTEYRPRDTKAVTEIMTLCQYIFSIEII